MYSIGSFGTDDGMSAFGSQFGLRSLGVAPPTASFARFSLSAFRPRITSTSSSFGCMGCCSTCWAGACAAAAAALAPSFIPTEASTPPMPPSSPLSDRDFWSFSRLPGVTGAVTAENPSSAATAADSPPTAAASSPTLASPAAAAAVNCSCCSRCLLRSLGVGVALLDRTFPAEGSIDRPLLNIDPALRELAVDAALIDEMPETELAASDSASLMLDLMLPSDMRADAEGWAEAGWGVADTDRTALSTLAFHEAMRRTSFASNGWMRRKNRVYFLSRRTSIVSRTLFPFLMTSRMHLKVWSSFRAPRVAVSVATSSTSARSISRLPINSHSTILACHSSSVSSSASSFIS
mmetsp:Transcript_31557/g.94428  ORF Transcript_31557/g.94428 Transcript_31557/m.94428 type:complete len:350 (-) Transcript_31557:12-1061(-)